MEGSAAHAARPAHPAAHSLHNYQAQRHYKGQHRFSVEPPMIAIWTADRAGLSTQSVLCSSTVLLHVQVWDPSALLANAHHSTCFTCDLKELLEF